MRYGVIVCEPRGNVVGVSVVAARAKVLLDDFLSARLSAMFGLTFDST